MPRIWLVLVFGLGLGIGGVAMAVHDHGHAGGHDGERVKEIATRDIIEKLDGQDAGVTFVEVTIEPGQEGAAHRHPGPGFVYVIEGEYELGIDDQPTKRFKAGEVFYEPTGCLHRVSRNPASKGRTRLIAVVLHPRGAKQVAIPELQKN